jgi:HSP20 family protein
MTMERWESRSELTPLREAIDRLMEDSFVGLGRFERFGHTFPMDICETDDAYIIDAQLPGFALEELQVSASGDTVTIRAERMVERTEPAGKKASAYIRHERYEGELRRSVTLPGIKADGVEATYQNGILTLHIPKAAPVKASSIPIKALP